VTVHDVYTALETEWYHYQKELHEHNLDLKALGVRAVPPYNPEGGSPKENSPRAHNLSEEGTCREGSIRTRPASRNPG
jgi:hypothetical protein